MYLTRNQFISVNMVFRLTCIIIISSVIHKTLLHTGLLKAVHSLWKNLDRGNIISANYLRRFRRISMFVYVFRFKYKTVHGTEKLQITVLRYYDDMWLGICARWTTLKCEAVAEEMLRQYVPQTVSSACSIAVKYRMPVQTGHLTSEVWFSQAGFSFVSFAGGFVRPLDRKLAPFLTFRLVLWLHISWPL